MGPGVAMLLNLAPATAVLSGSLVRGAVMNHGIVSGAERSFSAGVELGGTLAGKYRLDRILGVGGMGVVVGATHLTLDLPIAIKFMSPVLIGNGMGVRRFLLEARAAARIRSEHVVRVFDVASLPDGTPYIVMETLDGVDLDQLLERRGCLPLAEAVDYVLQAAEAVAEAHAAGIVHRDLKPSNLFCTRSVDGSPLIKVLDFGVSKLLPNANAALRSEMSTGPHVMVGSPLYAAPEQLRSPSSVDARADVWALGVILYELIAGRPPFRGDDFLGICNKVEHAPVEPLRVVRPEVPSGFSEVMARCLAKQRDQRFQTVAELAHALGPYAPRHALVSVRRIEVALGARPSLATPFPLANTSRSQPTPDVATVVAVRTGNGRIRGTLRGRIWALGALAGALVFASTVISLSARRKPAPAFESSIPSTMTVVAAQTPAPPDPVPEETDSAEPPQAPGTETSPSPPVPSYPTAISRPSPAPRRGHDTSKFGGLL
jgi:serine/threonine protein kinase